MLDFFRYLRIYIIFLILSVLFNIFKCISNKYNKWKNKIYKYAELYFASQ